MSEASKPADRTAELVRVQEREPGGPWIIELVGALDTPVQIGPYDNPAIAQREAKQVRQYLAALLARQ